MSKEKAQRYETLKCDYGWVVDETYNGILLPKFSVDGRRLECGQYVRNNIVSGRIVFYSTSCEFRIQVMNCRYRKDVHSISLFYPTPLGREENTNWQIWDEQTPKEEWLSYFPPLNKNAKKEIEDKIDE